MAEDGLLSLERAAALVRAREASPVELTRECLEKISREDSRYNSFIAVYAEEALADARVAEEQVARGEWRGALHGIPIALKDLIDVSGKVTTAASAVFLDNVAPRDAEVVRRLLEAGAVIVGKNNLHEFAYGGSGVISHFGPVKNPRDAARITGGSSSGSAAAVAAGFCFAAIGTDTAGSIRLPAACCKLVGLKPAFGRVSAEGVVPLSWSYDHLGPIARSVADVALVYRALADPVAASADTRRLRVGVAREFFFDGVDAEILKEVEAALERLRPEVEFVRDVKVPVDEDRTVSTAESWEFHHELVKTKAELYQPATLQRIRAGEKYAPPEIAVKRRELERLRSGVGELFREVDVIVSPTVPIAPPVLAELQAHPERLRATELLMLRNTRPWNVLGVPTITVPCGEGWVGMQIAGMTEAVVMRAARMVDF